ncbi:MAG: hypothetical protein JNM94_00610 [Phycisphaerae bacterium]|nr:hypothetical protein [Phycisphaerae bacterium]
MRRFALSLALLSVAATALVACSNSTKTADPGAPVSPQSYLAQIEKAKGMQFSSDRAKELKRIAGEDLNQPEQSALVDLLQSSQMFSRDKRDVLMALISNPTTTPATCQTIAANISQFAMYPEDADNVTQALALVTK